MTIFPLVNKYQVHILFTILMTVLFAGVYVSGHQIMNDLNEKIKIEKAQ